MLHHAHTLDLGLDLQVEQVPDDLLHEGFHHGVEHQATLALVLDQRVALGHRPQPNAFAQVVHFVEVFAPLAVEHGQQHLPLQLTHGVLAQGFLAGVVGVVGIIDELVDHRVLLGDRLDVVHAQRHRVQRLQVGDQLLQVPVVAEALGAVAHGFGDHPGHRVAQLLLHIGAIEHLATVAVDGVALAVHHVVVLEHVLAHLEVLRFNLLLGVLDGVRNPLMFDGLVLGDLEGHHGPFDHLGLEQPQQLVLQREVEPALARVTLTARATAQLVVDAARLVTLGADHVEPAQLDDLLVLGLGLLLDLLECFGPGGLVLIGGLDRVQPLLLQHLVGQEFGAAAEHDVSASTGHVGGHRHRTLATSHRDDRRLRLVVLGVQHLVRNALLAQQLRDPLRLRHRGGADQHWLALLVALGDVFDDGVELGVLAAIDQVGLVFADHRHVGRNRDDAQAVDLLELRLLGLGGAGHARELVVHAEEVLQRDRGQGLVLVLDLDAFLGLERLVQALVVAAAGQGSAGVLVHDQDFTVDDDVVLVELEQFLGLDGVVQVPDQRGVG